MNNILNEFTEQCIHRINENTPRVAKCLDAIDENELWKRPNEASNSIGNLILHLCGNMTQYVISSLGKVEDKRERDKEFSVTGGFSKKELMEKLNTTVTEVTRVIRNTGENEYLRVRTVQGFSYTGIGMVVHITEHYSYHTGQIALLTKLLKNKDLGFYKGVDLNAKNK
jgi:uncharacterized damage-inducible protein DinB